VQKRIMDVNSEIIVLWEINNKIININL